MSRWFLRILGSSTRGPVLSPRGCNGCFQSEFEGFSGGGDAAYVKGTARVGRIVLVSPTVKDKTIVQCMLRLRWIFLEEMV